MIEVDNKIIDPIILMERVRKNVLHKKKLDYEINASIDRNLDLCDLSRDIDLLHINIQKLNENWRIDDITIKSHRKYTGKIIILGKRFIRKMLYWFIRPYWDQHVNFNEATTKAISDMTRIQSKLIDSIEMKK